MKLKRKPKTHLRDLLVCVVVAFSVTSFMQPASADPNNQGTEFILGFMDNYHPGPNVLFLTGSVATNGTVDIPGLGFSAPFSIVPGTVTNVTLPSTVEHTGNDTIQNKGILVTSNDEVVVYGLNQAPYTTDAFLGLPTDILGTDHVVLAANSSVVRGSEFAVVATEDNTTVTITPSVSTGTRVAGVTYNVVLSRLESYQLKSDDLGEDLSGSIVTSDKPVAVFGGHLCANVPPNVVACDHVVEQIPPTATWGTSFLTESLATRTGGDIFRVAVRDDGTEVFLDGAIVATLNRGQFHEMDLASSTRHEVTTTGPALLMQYSKGSAADNVTADPFQMMIPPTQQFLTAYTLTTPPAAPVAFRNFINVVVPTVDIASCTLDAVALNPGDFVAIGASGFSAAQLPVAIGAHSIVCPNPAGAYSYGFADFDSYGYPGGLALAPIAEDGLKKELVDGNDLDSDNEIDLAVEVAQAFSSEYQFKLTLNNRDGVPVLVGDITPAEWQVTMVGPDPFAPTNQNPVLQTTSDDGTGDAYVYQDNMTANNKSATIIDWQPNPAESSSVLTVKMTTRSRPNGKKGPKFALASCGSLFLNDGPAQALKLDEFGAVALEEGEPVVLFEAPPLCLAAVKDLNGGGIVYDGTGDEDGDGLEDLAEACEIGTDPCIADTDEDGLPDSTDACPLEKPETDANGDGCEDDPI